MAKFSKTYDSVLRTRDGGFIRVRLTRKTAMAFHCTECMGWEENPAQCTSPLCALYPFRAKTLGTQKGKFDTAEKARKAK